MTNNEDALKWVRNDFKGASLGEYVSYKHEIIKALQAKEPQWKSIGEAPRNETIFICRKKSRPQITFEAFFTWEDEGYESNVKPYWLLCNDTTDYPIDDNYDYYEWTDLIKESENE